MVDKRGQHFYKISGLNWWFAVSSLILLASVIWMVWDDIDRPWKEVQREFFRLDEEGVRAALEVEEERLAGEGTLDELEEELGRADEELASHAAELAEARAGLERLEARQYRIAQDDGFAKAIYDTRRYEFESSRATRGPDHPETRRALEAYRRSEETTEQRRREYETIVAERNAAAERLDHLVGDRNALELRRTRLTAGIDLLRRRLRTLEPGLVSTVRNLPIIDFANPSVEVRQVVLRHLERDYHFIDVFRVDRCMTCHMGIDRPGFEDAPQPFTTHPRLELYLSSISAHPVAGFGCTVCHGGKGRATDFVDAAHTPTDPEQRSRWVEEHGWHRLEHWEHPIRPGALVESSCRKCHLEDDVLPAAELYSEGKLLYEKLGCFNCHKTEGLTEEYRKVGPNLGHVVDKVSPEWAFHWLKNPAALRPTTRMPRFFGLSNNSDPESLARSDVEIRALITYVFAQATPLEPAEIPVPGDSVTGERLFRTVGCVACHVVDDPDDAGTRGRDFGPNLAFIGGKTNERWLYSWLRDPQKHFPGARMPNLRLTEQEAADITAFLKARTGEQPEGGWSFPSLDQPLLETLVVEKLMERSPEAEAREKALSMATPEQLLYLGERLMAPYGCFGCHDLPGQEIGVRVGRDFTGQDAVGDKSIETVVFGFIDIPHTWHDWLAKKLEAPRIFDQGFERRAADKLRMPKFTLSPRQRDALVCFLLSLTNEKVPAESQRRYRGVDSALQRGEALVREFNCRACHRFSTDRLVFRNPRRGKGEPKEIAVRGVVTGTYEDSLFFRSLEDVEVGDWEFEANGFAELERGDWLRWERPIGGDSQDELLWFYAAEEGFDYDREEVEEGDEDAIAEWFAFRESHLHMLAPLIEGEAARTQPEWLFRFLKDPFDMRLHLDLRMPDFSLSDTKAHDLAEYFSAQDDVDYPFLTIPERSDDYRQSRRAEIQNARELFDSTAVQCISCHIRGGILPEGDSANWGPDLARAPQRLRPDWVIRWLEDPQLLVPGTRMPTFRSFSDQDRQAMKDFLMNFEHFYSEQKGGARGESR